MPNYNLNKDDLELLLAMTREKIGAARIDQGVDDDEMAHLYTLKGKLLRIQESRGEPESPAPKKTRTRKPKTEEQPEPGVAAV